jgi:hypothetical protein
LPKNVPQTGNISVPKTAPIVDPTVINNTQGKNDINWHFTELINIYLFYTDLLLFKYFTKSNPRPKAKQADAAIHVDELETNFELVILAISP